MRNGPGSELSLYLKIAQALEAKIRDGALRVGDRLPSIRSLRRQQEVSISTVLQAYFWLENRGCVEARPQSGFYVRVPFSDLIPEPAFEASKPTPTEVSAGAVLIEMMKAASDPAKVPFGAACPAPELFPNRKLSQIIQAIARQMPWHSSHYEPPAGSEALRRQIARRALDFGCSFSPGDIIVTCGAMEALNLGLRAAARPGDVIAIESPTYFGLLQAIESLGIRAIEIPTHPRLGMDLDLLEQMVRKHRIKVCMAMTNCHNPLGFVLPEERKKELVELTARHEVALIEDDIYGDLAFEGRPKSAKAFDRKGLVLLCASFSKVLAPGYRVGWIHAGRFRAEVERLKLISTISTPTLPQLTVARFLESGGYDRYLRRLRTAFAEQVHMVSRAAAKYFPEGTRITRPAGGYLLWVEFPKRVDAFKLYRSAQAENISISPGPIFSASGRFKNHVRMNCGHLWSDRLDRALLTLGKLAEKARQ